MDHDASLLVLGWFRQASSAMQERCQGQGECRASSCHGLRANTGHDQISKRPSTNPPEDTRGQLWQCLYMNATWCTMFHSRTRPWPSSIFINEEWNNIFIYIYIQLHLPMAVISVFLCSDSFSARGRFFWIFLENSPECILGSFGLTNLKLSELAPRQSGVPARVPGIPARV